MAIRQINPYLNFDGDAAKAAKLYESALGAKIEHLSRFGDMPGSDAKPEDKDRGCTPRCASARRGRS